MKPGFLAPGASAVQRERVAAAATTFLRRSGISAELAKQGADARTNWGDSGLAPCASQLLKNSRQPMHGTAHLSLR